MSEEEYVDVATVRDLLLDAQKRRASRSLNSAINHTPVRSNKSSKRGT